MRRILRPLLAHPRARSARRSRGQMIILAAVALLVLALITFITFNVTVAVQQRIKLQNYADAKAFSMAVAEARTLNYLAYTNRAIASSYVGMANVHAYMSEAAMLADLKVSAAGIMSAIAAEEYDMCFCCCTPFGCAPCCFQHCIDGAEATVNAAGLTLDYISGKMGSSLKKLDAPATQAVSSLNNHIQMLRASQMASKGSVISMLTGGNFGSLKTNNMQQAASVTSDEGAMTAANEQQWLRLFSSNSNVKKQIMAETVNASRQEFAWNRSGPLGPVPPTPMLFPNISQKVKASMWMGPTGTWTVAQLPAVGGHTAFRDGKYSTTLQGDAGNNVRGSVLTSVDSAMLGGTWRHGAMSLPLPAAGPLSPGNLSSGNSNGHSGGLLGFFNNPHSGSNHNVDLDMSRFEEFNIGTSYPFNQPSVFAAVSTDTRVNEYGQRGPWEVAKDGSGTVTMKKVGPEDAKLTLSNNTRSKAFSKAMVYYHRIGDWSDYPNMFNPFWRAKLAPLTDAEALVLGSVDSNAAALVMGVKAINGSAVNVK
ncbi:pilus assembly protein TadG-related protein [Hyalangium versicolor]|uniref:pilus assembly protein TadG-related protein n=1 Tax=Hyalangium versicolor TaxID=2861190 RepID=UPI001CCA6FF9|nr:pilus assembly protein TadG-related protein [Hyalangium versicolor]